MGDASEQVRSVHIVVYGNVQGVGFRYFVWQTAQKWHVNGWVRNLTDGSVEVLAEATEPRLSRFIEQVKKGSPFSTVEKTDVRPNERPTHCESFEINY